MDILLSLIPAIGWGVQPIILRRIGSSSTQDVFGFGLGAIIVGILVQIFFSPVAINLPTFLLSFLAGVAWIYGQAGQVRAYDMISVSRTMPISTGLQLIGTSLIGVLVFGDWASLSSKIIGALAIIVLIFGAYLTTVNPEVKDTSNDLARGVRTLAITSIGYWIYSAIPKMVSADAISIFLPEMLGIFAGAMIYVYLSDKEVFRQRKSWISSFVGMIFGVASLTYIMSAQLNGVTLAYILSQLNVVVATLGAIFIGKEAKTPRQLQLTYLGLVLIVGASIVTVFL
ncbi:GRP family sugar transporter [Streptococcus dentapri]|uniref:GRP family sugar transporter n=1 Tax=Streptococcus dentapri TaxID=573564 RepID=A0ABV8D0M5_9STRE